MRLQKVVDGVTHLLTGVDHVRVLTKLAEAYGEGTYLEVAV